MTIAKSSNDTPMKPDACHKSADGQLIDQISMLPGHRIVICILFGAVASPVFAEVRMPDYIDVLYDEKFIEELFAPVHHTHFSPLGTPYVHPFTIEPPQIHQDAFFIYKFTKNTIEGEDEFESEAHLDWALTERLGFVFAAPLVGLHGADGTHNVGFGDIEIAPRVMWIEREKFILASNFFITVPTGDETRGLGAGETVLSPYITTWHDLGNWNTMLINMGPDIGARSGDVSMTYSALLTHSILGPELLEDKTHHEEHHNAEGEGPRHFAPGMTTFYLEMVGETQLGDDRRTFIEILPGISYVLTAHGELRFGILVPVSKTQRFDRQYYASFTWIY